MIELIAILAVWRFTNLLVEENGPGDIFKKFRKLFGGEICWWCCSVWVGLLAALLISNDVGHVILLTLAFSAGAIIVDELL